MPWQPCSPQHVAHNPFTASEYHAMVPMLSQPQLLPPVSAPGEQTPWFQVLVAAVSKTIKDDEKNSAAEVPDAKQADKEMSPEDEKMLIEALKKWKEGELKMPEVFEELSKVRRTCASRMMSVGTRPLISRVTVEERTYRDRCVLFSSCDCGRADGGGSVEDVVHRKL